MDEIKQLVDIFFTDTTKWTEKKWRYFNLIGYMISDEYPAIRLQIEDDHGTVEKQIDGKLMSLCDMCDEDITFSIDFIDAEQGMSFLIIPSDGVLCMKKTLFSK